MINFPYTVYRSKRNWPHNRAHIISVCVDHSVLQLIVTLMALSTVLDDSWHFLFWRYVCRSSSIYLSFFLSSKQILCRMRRLRYSIVQVIFSLVNIELSNLLVFFKTILIQAKTIFNIDASRIDTTMMISSSYERYFVVFFVATQCQLFDGNTF